MKLILKYSILFMLVVAAISEEQQRVLFGPKAHNSIQNFVAAKVLNYVPLSIVIDNAQKMFFLNLERDSYFALQDGLKPNVSAGCVYSLREFVKGLKEQRLWAIEMVDSFGKIPSGILEGSVNAFGDFDQCVNTKVPERFQGRYCRIAVKSHKEQQEQPEEQSSRFKPSDVSYIYNKNSTKTLLEMAAEGGSGTLEYFPVVTTICVPSTCSEEEVGYLLAQIVKPSEGGLSVTLQHCLLKNELHLTLTHKIMLTAMTSLILLEVFATIIDFYISSQHPDEEHRSALKLPMKCLMSFSFRANTIRLFKADNNSDSIKIFHGMKFITMSWIILGHMLLYNLHAISRLVQAAKMAGGFFFQIAVNPFAAPDTYFFMSGFLVIYSYVKLNMPRVSFVYYAIYRYWRLVPPIAFVASCLVLSINLDHGPMFKEYIVDELIDQCEHMWWKNVLCINNYGGVDGQCMPWTWYIAVDFQLYLLTYFSLDILRKNPQKFIFILKSIIGGSVFYLIGFYVYYDLTPQPWLIYNTPEASKFYTKIAHYRPEPHVSSYCIGLLMGYYISTQRKIKLTKALKILGWLLSSIFGIIVVFATYLWNSGRIATTVESALYGGFYRLLWCLMISWITYMCTNENGGIVKSVLSWRGFIPLARLTYMAYLMHPIVIMLTFGKIRHSVSANYMMTTYFFVAFTVVTYFVSFIFCMICEAPFTALMSVLISSKVGRNGVNSMKKKKESIPV